MKTVSIVDIATAIGKTEIELKTLLPALTVLGFPEPEHEIDSVDVSALISWVTEQQEINLAIVSILAEKLDDIL